MKISKQRKGRSKRKRRLDSAEERERAREREKQAGDRGKRETSNYGDYQTETDSPSTHMHARRCRHRVTDRQAYMNTHVNT